MRHPCPRLCPGTLRSVWLRFSHRFLVQGPRFQTPDASLSEGMRQLNGVYTQRINKVVPLIYKVYGLEDATQAHRDMEASVHFGKIVLAAKTLPST
jgi:NADPH:quinone reductase-like Zn-dependent oxidoreductase